MYLQDIFCKELLFIILYCVNITDTNTDTTTDSNTDVEVNFGRRRCWTQWFNQDNPGGIGDIENLARLRKDNPGKICHTPLAIQAVTADDETPAEWTKQKIYA